MNGVVVAACANYPTEVYMPQASERHVYRRRLHTFLEFVLVAVLALDADGSICTPGGNGVR
jgi:hypothetical protein